MRFILMHKESGTGYEGVPVDKEVREQLTEEKNEKKRYLIQCGST